MSDRYSAGSAASTSAWSERVCELCGSASRTTTADGSLTGIGPESRAIPTCAPLWPTPTGSVAQDGERPETWFPRRERLKLTANNGNGAGLPLTIAVQADPVEWYPGRCPCRCHTSMSSAAASRVRTSASPARALGSKDHARVFGGSSQGSLGNYDPVTSSLRTSQLSLLGGSTECLRTLPRAGSMRSGTIFQRQPLAPLTDGIGSGLLPTPTTQDAANNGGSAQFQRNSLPLNAVAAERYATPQARDYRTGERHRFDNPERTQNLNDQIGGSLNPTWVEWLMGFPLGWTALEPSATALSRRSPNGSGNGS